MACASAPRKNKTASERKEQRWRSEARILARFTAIHQAISSHRGCQAPESVNTVINALQPSRSSDIHPVDAAISKGKSHVDVLSGIPFTQRAVPNTFDSDLSSRLEHLGVFIGSHCRYEYVDAVRSISDLYNGNVSTELRTFEFLVYGSWYDVDFEVLAVQVPVDTILGDLIEAVLPSMLDLSVLVDPMEPILDCPESDDYVFVDEVPKGKVLSVYFEVE